MYVLKNTDTDEEVHTLYADGYVVGDRALEGVVFCVETSPDGSDIEVRVRDEDADYFSRLNTDYWLIAMRDAVMEGAVELSTAADLSDDAGEIVETS